MIHVQETMAHKYNKRRRMTPNFSKGSVANVKILKIKLLPIRVDPMRLWPRRHTTSMSFKWTNGD